MNVPGTCVWKMMLRYKYVLLEVASLTSSFVTAQFAENMFFFGSLKDGQFLQLHVSLLA